MKENINVNLKNAGDFVSYEEIIALAQQFENTTITLEKDGVKADARDLLSILALDCPQGTRLVLKAVGPQAREAASAICSLFARKFGEP